MEAASKHTPGPWHFEGWDGFKGVVHDEESFIIAEQGEDAEAWPANARLIAAAPDLLKSLRAMLDAMDDGSDEPTLVEARAAVAKAAGTAPDPEPQQSRPAAGEPQ